LLYLSFYGKATGWRGEGKGRLTYHFVVHPYSENGRANETDESSIDDVREVFFGEDERYDEADEAVYDYEWHGV
jgi:hypothetical protein